MNRARIIEPEGVDLERLTATRHKKRRIVKPLPPGAPGAVSPSETDRQRIAAYLRAGTFKAAAKEIGQSEETISATWHRFRGMIAAEVYPACVEVGR